MADVKPAVSKPANASGKTTSVMLINTIIVVTCIIVAHVIFYTVFASTNNFNDGAARHQPKNLMGTMYLGGWVVPILISTFLTAMCFIIERALTVFKSRGKMTNAEFIKKFNTIFPLKISMQPLLNAINKQEALVM